MNSYFSAEICVYICENPREKYNKVEEKKIKDRENFNKVLKFFSKFIDYPAAIAGAVMMGVIVGYINRKFGLWPAFTAALKQAAYTFLFGGSLTKLLYYIQGKIPGKFASVFFSVIIITTITVILVYIVHNLRGTPMPLESTIPTAILAPFGFSFLAYRRLRRSKS